MNDPRLFIGAKQKLPPQKRYQRFTEEEWKANIKGAVTAGFGTMTSTSFISYLFIRARDSLNAVPSNAAITVPCK